MCVFEPCLPTPFVICSLYFHPLHEVLIFVVSRLRQGEFGIEQGPLAMLGNMPDGSSLQR